ncbi:MAG: hypothetical protein J7L38_06295 [Thermoproteales archaeon]|nr:hypothetical protein [Thermoproteales archaeon]
MREKGVREAFIRASWYVRAKVISHIRKNEWIHLQPQEELLAELFREKGFILIILDACRYDYFQKYAKAYLDGCLKMVRSPASWTGGWLKIVFEKFRKELENVKIFSATPFINSKGINVKGFNARKYVKGEIIDIWKLGWDEKLNTVHPDTVVKIVIDEGIGDRNIIWFMQPHFPYIGSTKLIIPKGYGPWEYIVRSGRVSREYLIKAYRDNLILVLKSCKKLLKNLDFKGRCVITSDHGEALGEAGVYLHPAPHPELNLPEQRIVPWLDIHKQSELSSKSKVK